METRGGKTTALSPADSRTTEGRTLWQQDRKEEAVYLMAGEERGERKRAMTRFLSRHVPRDLLPTSFQNLPKQHHQQINQSLYKCDQEDTSYSDHDNCCCYEL